jgi:hypothetical protein
MESRRWTKQLNLGGLLRPLIKILYIAFLVQRPALFFPSIRAIEETWTDSALKPSLASLAADYRKGCPKHRFRSIQLVSREPHIMLIEGFLTEAEAEILVDIAYIPIPCYN